MGDDTNRLAFGFQDRALFDVQFKCGMDRLAHRLVAGITDARQFLAHGQAIDVGS